MHTETAHGSGGWMPGPRCERPATGVGALNGCAWA